MKIEQEFDFTGNGKGNEFIPSLWATRKVGYLLEQIRLTGENKELIDEVVDLSKRYGIITPYTSYLIIEDEERQIADRRIRPSEQTLSAVIPRGSERYRPMKFSYSEMKGKEGAGSVDASKSLQDLSRASNIVSTEKMLVQQNAQQINQQFKKVLGKAMYRNGKFWVDPEVQKKKYSQQLQIKFGSDEYFRLLKEKPAISQFLALGQNLRFVYGNTFYEISE